MRNLSRSLKKGFTLVELLIVIIIIAVLAAIAIPKFANSSSRSKDSSLKGNLRILRNSVEMFKSDTGLLPAALADLAASPTNGLDSSGTSKAIPTGSWRGPYVQTVPVDPVSGSAFSYTTSGANLGKVAASATGNDTDGNPYSGY